MVAFKGVIWKNLQDCDSLVTGPRWSDSYCDFIPNRAKRDLHIGLKDQQENVLISQLCLCLIKQANNWRIKKLEMSPRDLTISKSYGMIIPRSGINGIMCRKTDNIVTSRQAMQKVCSVCHRCFIKTQLGPAIRTQSACLSHPNLIHQLY